MLKDIQIQTTNICNARCLFCPYPQSLLSKNKSFMSDEVFRHVVSQLASSSIPINKILLYLQAEPFTDPSIFDRICYIRDSLTFNRIELSTNCSLLTPEVIDGLVKTSSSVPISIWLSFQETNKEDFKRLTGLEWSDCYDNLCEFFIRTDNTSIQRWITCIGKPESIENFWLIMMRDLGISRLPKFRTKPHISRAGNVKGKYAKRIVKSGKAYLQCERLIRWLHINWKGELIPCCMDYDNEIVIGDLNKENLATIQKNIFERMQENEQPGFLCYRCEYA